MTGKTSQEGTKKYNDALSDMSNESVEYVRGITVVKTFGQTVFSLKKFTSSIDRYQKFVIDFTKNYCFPMVIYTTIINSISVFLLMGALFFTKDGVTTEFTLNFSFYLIITPLISVVLSKIMHTSENKLVVSDALNRINEVLEKKTAIQNVSMCIESGEKVALVGESGSGKTTLANLVSRFFDAQSGTIEIGGVNVKDISKEHLMDTVSSVFQRNVLMKGSILENVRMGKEEATEQEVIAALQLAQCLDIIEKLPDGIHTVIGTEGSYLSGGEIQRIIIARAILKDAPILILDEATTFADADNEMRIQQALDELSKRKTVIMIAHRLSTVNNVDKIFVLKSGEICESGTPQQLMDKKDVFYSMWQEYATSVSWKI